MYAATNYQHMCVIFIVVFIFTRVQKTRLQARLRKQGKTQAEIQRALDELHIQREATLAQLERKQKAIEDDRPLERAAELARQLKNDAAELAMCVQM